MKIDDKNFQRKDKNIDIRLKNIKVINLPCPLFEEMKTSIICYESLQWKSNYWKSSRKVWVAITKM